MSVIQRGRAIRNRREVSKQFRVSQREFISGLDDVLKKLDKITAQMHKKDKRKMLSNAANPLINNARAFAPMSDKPHYSKSGDRTITYLPGNLKQSIRVLPLRRTNTVWVGPKIVKRATSDTYGRRATVNAYYAHFVEFGTINLRPRPFMRPALDASRNQVRSILVKEAEKLLKSITK